MARRRPPHRARRRTTAEPTRGPAVRGSNPWLRLSPRGGCTASPRSRGTPGCRRQDGDRVDGWRVAVGCPPAPARRAVTPAAPAAAGAPNEAIGTRARRSTNRANRYVRVAGDVGHLHPTQARFVDIETPPARGELFDRDPALHSCQRRPEAAVHPVAEADGDPRLSFDVELVGALESAGIPGRRSSYEEHREAGGDGAALELALFLAVPPLVLGRRPVPENLLDRP